MIGNRVSCNKDTEIRLPSLRIILLSKQRRIGEIEEEEKR